MSNRIPIQLPDYDPAFNKALDQSAEALLAADSIATLSHVNPDGDTLGSAIALGLALKKIGKKVAVKCIDPAPRVFTFLPGVNQVDTRIVPCEDFDRVVLCDTGDFSRVGGVVVGHSNLMVIDHHRTNSGFAEVNLIDPTVCATGILVYRLLQRMNIPLDKEIATNLYVAINTDTGTFRYSNTDVETFAVCADLFQHGLNAEEINLAVFESFSESRQRLLGRLLSEMELLEEGRLVVMTCTQRHFAETGADKEDLDNVISEARNIDTARVAVLFREDGPDEWKISLRAKGEVNIHPIAAQLGGGGHAKAAGATLLMPYDQAREKTLDLLIKTLRESQ